MQTAIARERAVPRPMPTVKVICVRCMSAYVEVALDGDKEPVCEEPCAPPHVRIHEEPLSHFPTTE